LTVESEVDCPACGSKVKIGNGHSAHCPHCGGKIIRYRKKNKTRKLNFHPRKLLQSS